MSPSKSRLTNTMVSIPCKVISHACAIVLARIVLAWMLQLKAKTATMYMIDSSYPWERTGRKRLKYTSKNLHEGHSTVCKCPQLRVQLCGYIYSAHQPLEQLLCFRVKSTFHIVLIKVEMQSQKNVSQHPNLRLRAVIICLAHLPSIYKIELSLCKEVAKNTIIVSAMPMSSCLYKPVENQFTMYLP